MAFDQIKTQVLILHSQQSILEALGSGFNDQFAVHFATTGSEALNTLNETPIHIIVSALDLPGMSGIETLREAKKRAPDMIGILLAGDRGSGEIEALVGEQEVYQIVRGNIAASELVNIVEDAARQVRMLTISKSANDNEVMQPEHKAELGNTRSNFDPDEVEYTNEHIILETLDNGAALVTEASDRLPILNTNSASPDSGIAERSVDVLVLSKDHALVDTIRDAAHGLHTVHHAITAHQAQEIVASSKVGVLVTDAAIADNKVALLTYSLRSHAPRLVVVIAGRRDDGESLMELINKGQIYRFLLKPVSAGRAKLAVEASVKYHLEAPDNAFRGHKPADDSPALSADPSASTIVAASNTRETTVAKLANAEPDERAVMQARADEFVMPPDQFFKLDGAAVPDKGLRLPVLPSAISAALVLGIGAWYLMASPGGEMAEPKPLEVVPAASSIAAAAPPVQPMPDPDVADAYVSLLDNARYARDSGRLLAPASDNALEWYLEARLAAPDNAIVRDELAALIEQVIGRAETAMLENRISDVDTILQMVALADPDNSRLAFLRAQRDQQQLRSTLDEARSAIRAGRFEDADRLLGLAGALPGGTAAVIKPTADDLAAARGTQQLDELLTLANTRLAEGQLISPPNDSARYYFELAAAKAPDKSGAQQGLQIIASKLVLNARSALDSEDLATAAQLLEEARALDADSRQLQATERALRELQARQASTVQRPQVERVPATQETPGAAAVAERRPAAITRDGPDHSLPSANVGIALAKSDGGDLEAVATNVSADRAGNAPAAAISAKNSAANIEREPVQVAGNVREDSTSSLPKTSDIEWATMGQLNRRNYVAPKYPRNARRRNVSGWVNVGFTVAPDGTVRDLEIIDSLPEKTFNGAVLDAVGQWRFEPIIQNGRPVAKRVAVRMTFNLQ